MFNFAKSSWQGVSIRNRTQNVVGRWKVGLGVVHEIPRYVVFISTVEFGRSLKATDVLEDENYVEATLCTRSMKR